MKLGCTSPHLLSLLLGSSLLFADVHGITPTPGAESATPIQILVLAYGDKDSEGILTITEHLRARLESELQAPVWMYSESFAEPSIGHDPGYEREMLKLLQRKYSAQEIRLVVTIGSLPLHFATHYQEELLPKAPRLYMCIGAGPATALPNSYGYIWKFNFAPTVDIALSQQPTAKRLLLITGTGVLDRSLAELALPSMQEGVRRSGRPVAIDFIRVGTFDQVREQLAHLTAETIPIYISYHADTAGQSFVPLRAVTQFAAVANRPIYAPVSSYLGRGIVGGSLADAEAMGDELGKAAAQILRGTPPSSNPQLLPDRQIVAFDWNQMKRFGIGLDQLPPGSRLINRQPGLWELYKHYVLVALALLVLQASLILLLLRQRAILRRDKQEISNLSSRLIQSQEDERARIARELHDDVNQQLALIAIELQNLQSDLPDGASTRTQEIWQRAVNVSRDVGQLAHDLHSAKLKHLGLVPALKSLASEFASHEHIEVSFQSSDVPNGVPPKVSLALFRIAQEGLRNASRHGKAKLVNLRLTSQDGRLALTIQDQGSGFDVSRRSQGLGLISMRERMRSVQGDFQISSQLGTGTKIVVTLALSDGAYSDIYRETASA